MRATIDDELDQVEDLLHTWYTWQQWESAREVRAHWYPSTDATCRGYEPDEYDDEDAGDLVLAALTAATVEVCVGALPIEMRAAVSSSMQAKRVGARLGVVSIEAQHLVYQAAKRALLPMLVGRGLITMVEAA